MLELRSLYKDYLSGENTVHALKNVELTFRESEFVSILGPSGCGKTTLLNIIGGLDHYTKGDLIINGRSTKQYKDRDWDTYRNHSIGFVFQSYNLIPHQSVLANVELALTLSGVGRKERRRRAVAALEEVGLGNQLRKRPSELSGGQMQRVAIARALVNDPEIILADEPTGALDTETSVQVMEILKGISKNRLIIMVTHNPDLAEQYSTRIIRMLDGVIQSDTWPLSPEEKQALEKAHAPSGRKARREKKPSMGFGTGLLLSLKNLFTKKGRTVLTSFAGSIGIIGIALILAVSQGMTAYINAAQEESLSSYPLSILHETADLSSVLASFTKMAESQEHDLDKVYEKAVLYNLADALSSITTSENDLKSFKTYLEAQLADPESALHEAVTGISYGYDLEPTVYTATEDGILESNTTVLLQELMGQFVKEGTSMAGSPMASMMMSSPSQQMNLWQQLLPGTNGDPVNPLIRQQYDLLYGTWPNRYDQVVLVLDENNELSDVVLYALGLESKEYMESVMHSVITQEPLAERETPSYSYAEICGREYRVILNGDRYTYNSATGTYVDTAATEAGLEYLYNQKSIALTVTGVIRQKEDVNSPMLAGCSIGYTDGLTREVIARASECPSVQAQLASPNVDVLTGLPFRANTYTEEEKAQALEAYIGDLSPEKKAQTYVTIQSIMPQDQLAQQTAAAMEGVTEEEKKAAILDAFLSRLEMSEQTVREYVEDMNEGEIDEYYTQIVSAGIQMAYASQVAEQLGVYPPEQLATLMDEALPGYTQAQRAEYYEKVLEFSETTYEENLLTLGLVDESSPASINLYTDSFAHKDVIGEEIDRYNEGREEEAQIHYNDLMGVLMSAITDIIDAIAYVLIAFVSISLVVSSIMIAVITLISVQERTKEIGILRAIGASKGNVSAMFNAETILIGFTSGVLGVAVSWLICIPINALLHKLTGIGSLNAVLPWKAALILVGISMLLTLISGFIPSRAAAKKDPVVALRTE